MKKHLGLIVLAGSIAWASLAAAQVPAPPSAPAPPAPPAPVAAPAYAPEAVPAPAPTPAVPGAPSVAPAPMPQAPAAPAKPAKPPKAAEAPKAPETPPPPPAPPSPDEMARGRIYDAEPVNFRFDVTVSSQTGTAAPVKRSASVTVSNGAVSGPTGMGMLRSGNSIPVPSTTLTTKGEDGKETPTARPLTSYNYRSVGLNVDVQNAMLLRTGRVSATLNIEFSGVDDKAVNTTGAPSFPTFSQRLNLFFDSGKPLIVAQSSDYVDNVERKQTVEVKATILR